MLTTIKNILSAVAERSFVDYCKDYIRVELSVYA